MRFRIVAKGKTPKGCNYYKMDVEVANGIWISATYFGNTVPKEITRIKLCGEWWIAQIQPHTSRNRDTGRFSGRRAV
jgi:hypothetical protein